MSDPISTGLFVQLNVEPSAQAPAPWEEVDHYTYKNYEKALDDTGKQRYTKNRIRIESGQIVFDDAVRLNDRDMGAVIQFCRLKTPTPLGTVVRHPNYIQFASKRKEGITLHKIGGGDFVAHAAKNKKPKPKGDDDNLPVKPEK